VWPFTWKREVSDALCEIRAGLGRVQAQQSQLLRNQATLARNQQLIWDRLETIERLIKCGYQPGEVTVTITGERSVEGMADKIQFDVNLPPKAAPDVVNRELTVDFGDGNPNVFELSGDENVVTGLEGDQDSTVNLALVDIDDAGNRSEASTASATLVDSVAPPKPGELGVTIIGETHEEDPVDPDPVDPVE
jgi:hypothetical protein